MRNVKKYSLACLLTVFIGSIFTLSADQAFIEMQNPSQQDSQPAVKDSSHQAPRFPVAKTEINEFKELDKVHPIDLRQPENINREFEYDAQSNSYIMYSPIGNEQVSTPIRLSQEEYFEYSMKKSMQNYYRKKNTDELIAKEEKDKDAFSMFDMKFDLGPAEKIFGPGGVQLQTQGSTNIKMAINRNYTGDPTMTSSQQTRTSFDFDSQIQANVNAKVGDKVNFGLNYNTEASFDFDTKKIKLGYEGKEDEIIKHLEAGNVSMNTSNSLIRGGSALFGIKTELQFGKLKVGAVFSQQESESRTIASKGGVQTTPFEISADAYEENRHFFLAHYFWDNYDDAMKTLPHIKSGITIGRVEVWVTNTKNNFNEARNFVAFADLGEYDHISNPSFVQQTPGLPYSIPDNKANNLYSNMVQNYPDVRDISAVNKTLTAAGLNNGIDYEKVENASKLSASDYTLNTQLGYISLKRNLQSDEVLAVAFEYNYAGKTYQLGEFSTDKPGSSTENIYLKLIRGTTLSPRTPFWNLMMKNVYSLNTYSLQQEKFKLDILFQNDTTGTYLNYISEGAIANKILLQVMNLDRLNSRQDPYSDGFFDYIENYTVSSQSGRIMFPVKEPFGNHLRTMIADDAIADKYVFQELYDSTLTIAKQIAEKNKYIMRGEYKGSSGAGIDLGGANIARGSVRVVSNGVLLTENVHYTVDYASGNVIITDEAILASGAPYSISTENSSSFGMQRKTMMGMDMQYAFTPKFNVGATIMNLKEMPITMKTGLGEESVNNTLYGFNTNYKTESQWLTNLVDKLPFINISAPSQINFSAEFAQLLPGHYESKYGGNYSYIDDFEKTKMSLDIRSPYSWTLASTPADASADALFPEGSLVNDINYGKNRAHLAWFYIEPMFTRKRSSMTPNHIKNDLTQLSNHYVREVHVSELSNKDQNYTEASTISTLNLAFDPLERGPYNLDAEGIDPTTGMLLNPQKRWGGIMRKLDKGYTDFESANIEYIEFWMLDPFIDQPNSRGGNLYFNLGDISEDVLKDEKKFFENGLPIDGDPTAVTTTVWGKVPTRQSLTYAFDAAPGSRAIQDVGLNGLSTQEELTQHPSYVEYIAKLEDRLNPEVIARMKEDQFSPFNDPGGDNFHHYRGSDYDRDEVSIIDRYRRYNGTEGNSRASGDSPEKYDVSAKRTPDVEDINQDNTLNENEKYFQYKISLAPEKLIVGENFISDIREVAVTLRNGEKPVVKWYQFKIPVQKHTKKVGEISDFKNIRFMRMFLHDFSEPIKLRFATLELVRGDWRIYAQDLSNPNLPVSKKAGISVSAVNLEENNRRVPVNYVLPPGVNRIIDPGQTQIRHENEQSLSLRITEMAPGDAAAVYKSSGLDARQYRRLQMFVHAERFIDDLTNLNDNQLSVFMRLGSDYKNNYYEYEIPLKMTAPGEYLDNSTDREAVWPKANMFDFPFEILTNLKLKRNKLKRQSGSNITYHTRYSEQDPYTPLNSMHIIGNPSLSEVKVIMIGVRNNSRDIKSGEIWVNELRLTDFNEDGGWAGNANLNINLSDLGAVNFAGRIETAGFGGLEQGIMERNLDDHYQYNVSTNLELGKLFPEKANITLPMYYTYSEQITSPKYDPLNQDILLKDALNNLETQAEKDSVKKYAQDKIITRGINFNNMRVGIKSKKPMPYDPINFSFGYSFLENRRQEATTEYERNTNQRGNINYSYSPFVKPFEPFKNMESKSEGLKFAKELSFTYLPNSISFFTEMMRDYYEVQLRDLNNMGGQNMIPVSIREDFLWNRGSAIQWNLTKNLNLSLQTGTQARIESPNVQVNKKINPDEYKLWKDSVLQSIRDLGTPLAYAQSFSASYAIPLRYIPHLEWITASYNYTANYNWDRGARLADYTQLGNTISSTRTMGFNNVNFNLMLLYNKSPFLKSVNQKYVFKRPAIKNTRTTNSRTTAAANEQAKNPLVVGEKTPQQLEKEKKKKKYEGDVVLNMDSATIVSHQLDNKRLRISARRENGKLYPVEFKAIDNNSLKIDNLDSINLKLVVYQLPKMEETLLYKIAQVSTRGLMSVRNVGFSYTETQGLMVPNFRQDIGDFFGQGSSNYGNSPGLDFAFGMADKSYIDKALSREWLVRNEEYSNTLAMFNYTKNFTFRAALEPFVGCRIDLNALHTHTQSEGIDFVTNLPNKRGGTFTMSTIAIRTAFESSKASNNYRSKTFDQFLDNRKTIKARLQESYTGRNYPNVGFIEDSQFANQAYDSQYGSYDENSSDVLIPAFLAAYTGTNSRKVGLSSFPSLLKLLPNWKVTYDGFMQLDAVNNIFKSFVISHAYSCNYSVGNYASYANWAGESDGIGYIQNISSGFPVPSSPYEVSSVNLTEGFNPLVGVNASFKNNTMIKMELKNTRMLNLNVSSYQVVETSRNEYVVGLGYKLTEFNKTLKMKASGGSNFSNDLTVTGDVSYQKLQTLIRKIEDGFTQATNGEAQVMLKFAAKYNLSRLLMLEAFYDKQISKPIVVSTSYPTSKSSFGVSLNISLTR